MLSFLVSYIIALHFIFFVVFLYGAWLFNRDYIVSVEEGEPDKISLALLFITLAMLAGEGWSLLILLDDESRYTRLVLRSAQQTGLGLAWLYLLHINRQLNKESKQNGRSNKPEDNGQD